RTTSNPPSCLITDVVPFSIVGEAGGWIQLAPQRGRQSGRPTPATHGEAGVQRVHDLEALGAEDLQTINSKANPNPVQYKAGARAERFRASAPDRCRAGQVKGGWRKAGGLTVAWPLGFVWPRWKRCPGCPKSGRSEACTRQSRQPNGTAYGGAPG